MNRVLYIKRIELCTKLMHEDNLDILLLAKPANMFYLTGDENLGLDSIKFP